MNTMIKIKEIMTRDVWFVNGEQKMSDVEVLFRSNPIHHLPVLDEEGMVVGIVSKSDYYMLLDNLNLFSKEKESAYNTKFLQTITVSEIMSRQVACLREDDTALLAVALFRENLFHALPVVAANNQLIGILTTFDLLKFAYYSAPVLGSGVDIESE